MTKPNATHEDFSRGQEVKGSSNRSFGIVFAAVFLVIGLWPLAAGAGSRSTENRTIFRAGLITTNED